MFQWILAGLAAAAFGGIAIHEATKPTGDKVKAGDSVFANASAITLADSTEGNIGGGVNADSAGLTAFLAGFLSTSVKVTNVQPSKARADSFVGTILGFPRLVGFPKSAVASIERNGKRIT